MESAAAWIRRRRRQATGAPADPLGAGNTALIGASGLNVTPLAFYDVRKNLTQSGGTVSSLADVKGDGTYGPAVVQATGAKQPVWDGTTINFDGTTFLLTGSAVTGLDLSTLLTCALVADVQGTSSGTVVAMIGAASAGTPYWRTPLIGTALGLKTATSSNLTGASSTAVAGTGNVRLILMRISAADQVTIEVPAIAKVTSSTVGTMASGNQLIALGGTTSGTAGAAMRFRALLIWAGDYTVAQRDTLKTWAATYHAMVLA